MITKGELRTLIALHGKQTVSGLVTQLDHCLSYTSELVETRREG